MAKKPREKPTENDARLVIVLPESDKREFQKRADDKRLSASALARMLIAEFLRKGGGER
jgi:hypothetical protein